MTLPEAAMMRLVESIITEGAGAGPSGSNPVVTLSPGELPKSSGFAAALAWKSMTGGPLGIAAEVLAELAPLTSTLSRSACSITPGTPTRAICSAEAFNA